jgi:hypothetical protein
MSVSIKETFRPLFIGFMASTAFYSLQHKSSLYKLKLFYMIFAVVSVHVLDTRMPISLQFPTVEDTRGTIEWVRMEDSLFLPAQALLEYAKDGN